jgi:hypothetical protein
MRRQLIVNLDKLDPSGTSTHLAQYCCTQSWVDSIHGHAASDISDENAEAHTFAATH